MAVLCCFLLALGVFVKTFLCRGVMEEPCIVRISANPFAKKVHATPVACFNGTQNLQLEELGDFRNEIELANSTDEVKEKCALLAHAKGYKYFALGMSGLCLSSNDIQHNIYFIRDPNQENCREGYGIGDSMFLYSLEPLPVLQPFGCFIDKPEDRALPEHCATFYSQFNDENTWEMTVYQCGWVAYHKGYKYFAVQNCGECWTQPGNAWKCCGYDRYVARHEMSSNCSMIDELPGFGVGKANAIFVYQIE